MIFQEAESFVSVPFPHPFSFNEFESLIFIVVLVCCSIQSVGPTQQFAMKSVHGETPEWMEG